MSTPGTLYRTGILLLALWLSACISREKDAGTTAASEPAGDTLRIGSELFEANEMELGNPQLRDFPEQLMVSGTIDVPPENRAVVSAVRGGFVKSISLLVGDRVRVGQQIVSLENPEFLQLQQDYLETREQLPFKEAEYLRQKTLYEEEISSEKLFLQAESDYKTALARLGGLASQLELLNFNPGSLEPGKLSAVSRINAPIAGSITRVNVSKGAFVSQVTEIVEIVDNDHIHLELKVYEKDISKLRVGQAIRFGLPEVSEEQYSAKVYLIGTTIGSDRTVKVHAHLEEEVEAGTGFLVGMFVRARIELDVPGNQDTGAGPTTKKLSLPETAVVSGAGQSYILILEERTEDGYRMRQLPVTAGPAAAGYIAVSGEGLTADSRVLIRGAFNLVNAP